MKILIFDSSSLITITMNGLTYLLKKLKKQFKGKFIITEEVKYETIDRPYTIKKFQLGALKIKNLLDEKIIEMPSSINIKQKDIKNKTAEILRRSNNAFFTRREFMHIIDKGEASCLALSLLATEKKIENLIVVDERTTRMIGEKPENLRKLFENKLHTKVQLKDDFDFLKKIKFIRSSELVYLAYKKGLVELKNESVLDALLYAVKYKGCAISRQEIDEVKRLKF
jgi:predicted nucleic acid-binding protein